MLVLCIWLCLVVWPPFEDHLCLFQRCTTCPLTLEHLETHWWVEWWLLSKAGGKAECPQMALQPARQVNSARHLPAATPTTHTALKTTAVARCHSPSVTCKVLAQCPVLFAIELHTGPWSLPPVHVCPSPHMLCPFLHPSLPALCNLHCQPNRLAHANAATNNTLLLLLTFACFIRLHLWLKRMCRPHRHRHPRSVAIHWW
ncbi:hypothetical protein GQ54DRAFT_100305 [Martensiomyces pterosporus]|nr:hypothetical protein GQ54DRAFT_100305 [Martensiomyces pterosporus]